ncbi:YraN family protein [bacterium]|nr:YraN family protein [bacterium]
MSKKYNKTLGQRGENIARTYYQKLGWKLIKQNYWTPQGELDLVLEKNKEILVVEVKTRSNRRFGWGEETINQQKINNILKAYQILQRHSDLSGYFSLEICVVEIGKKITIRSFALD